MAQKAHANALVADLSKDQIRVASNFTGEKILLFGAIEDTGPSGASDVVVVVRGPSENFTLRRKKRGGHLGQCRSAHADPCPDIMPSPARALADIAPVSERAKHQIGPNICAFHCSTKRRKPPPHTLACAISRFIMTVLCVSKADKTSIQSTRT